MSTITADVVAKVLEFLWDWSERSRTRLVCRRWDRAFTSLLENTLSEQQSPAGEWIPQGRYCTKHTLCHLHRMPQEVLASLTAVDFRSSFLGKEGKAALAMLFEAIPSFTQSVSAADEGQGSLSLSFADCRWLTDEALMVIPSCFKEKIVSMTLSRCFNVTSLGLGFLKELTSLTELSLAQCHHFPTDAVGELVRSLLQLRKLSLQQCRQIVDSTVASWPIGLTDVDLAGCIQLTDKCVAELCKLTGLKVLRLANCFGASKESARSLSLLPKLKNLHLSSGLRLNDNGVADLSRCSLRHLYLPRFTATLNQSLPTLTGVKTLDLCGSNNVVTKDLWLGPLVRMSHSWKPLIFPTAVGLRMLVLRLCVGSLP